LVTVEPITQDFGAEIGGLKRITPQLIDIFRESLLKHHLLVLRARILTPAELLSLAQIFGTAELWGDKFALPGHPGVYRITNQPGQGHHVGQYWHADGTIRRQSTAISLWHVVRFPEEGGDTLFANMHRAYDELPGDLKARLDDLRMIAVSGATHPVIQRHPVTGRKALYSSVRNTKVFSGLNEKETSDLLARLDAHLDRPGGHYRHKWREGDVVIGDNYAVAHKGTPTDPRFLRVLHRVTIRGDAAFYPPELTRQAEIAEPA
jgi:taurine dioxygenase